MVIGSRVINYKVFSYSLAVCIYVNARTLGISLIYYQRRKASLPTIGWRPLVSSDYNVVKTMFEIHSVHVLQGRFSGHKFIISGVIYPLFFAVKCTTLRKHLFMYPTVWARGKQGSFLVLEQFRILRLNNNKLFFRAKYLGIVLDKNMSLNIQAREAITKASKVRGILYPVLNRKSPIPIKTINQPVRIIC